MYANVCVCLCVCCLLKILCFKWKMEYCVFHFEYALCDLCKSYFPTIQLRHKNSIDEDSLIEPTIKFNSLSLARVNDVQLLMNSKVYWHKYLRFFSISFYSGLHYPSMVKEEEKGVCIIRKKLFHEIHLLAKNWHKSRLISTSYVFLISNVNAMPQQERNFNCSLPEKKLWLPTLWMHDPKWQRRKKRKIYVNIMRFHLFFWKLFIAISLKFSCMWCYFRWNLYPRWS